jgi:NAD(P)-dependent dehydrogenase (short-subunit alcohol dehydrogenase family)
MRMRKPWRPSSNGSSGRRGRIDLLVNNAWGGHESFDGRFDVPFWERPLSHWPAMMDGGARLHWLTARAVAALAADPQVMRHSGRVLRLADLAEGYGFTDIDGRRAPAFALEPAP